jgi:hypothetical protein
LAHPASNFGQAKESVSTFAAVPRGVAGEGSPGRTHERREVLLRIRRRSAERPFRTPWLFLVGPLGIGVNLIMMLFLPLDTCIRLVVWLVLGLVIYLGYGQRHSIAGKRLSSLIPAFDFGSPTA